MTRPIDKITTRYHTDLRDEKLHVPGRSKQKAKRFAKRKSSKAYRRALKSALMLAAGLWLFAGPCGAAEELGVARPAGEQIAEITVEGGGVEPGISIESLTQRVRAMVESYHVVSEFEWSYGYSHVAGLDRMGSIILADGTRLRWMMRPGGLGTVRYPDGRQVYLAREITSANHVDIPWMPAARVLSDK